MKNKSTQRKSPYLSEIEKQISKRKAQIAALDERYEGLLQRKKAMLERHGGQDVKPTDIIRLNVGGKDMFASRETLTLVKGSRLEDLFCGKWENRLIRDEKGCVFLDLDPSAFEQVLEYLYHFKMGLGEEYLANHAGCALFELYVDYFDLRSSSKERAGLSTSSGDDSCGKKDENDDEDAAFDDDAEEEENQADGNESDQSATDVATLIQKEEDSIKNYEKELNELEKSVDEDDKFVGYFLLQQDEKDVESIKKHAASDTPGHDADIEDVLYLLVQGQTIGVKRSTLCLDEESLLAQNVRNEAWIKDHSVFVGGRSHILMEHPAIAVVDMLNCLRCISMNIPKVKVDKLMPRYLDRPFWTIVRCYFPNEYSPFSILNKEQMKLLRDWITKPVTRMNEYSPSLLYRASSDGWDFEAYKKKCWDRLYSFLTVIKTADGYILGGYTNCRNEGWTSIKDSFLFSLINPEGHAPLKMQFKNQGTNFVPFRCLSSVCGPAFGGTNFAPTISSNARFCYSSDVMEGEYCAERIRAAVANMTWVGNPRADCHNTWRSNINLGQITLFDISDSWKSRSKYPATVGVDLCVTLDGKGYACIEHAYELPEGMPNDFMTGSSEFEVADFEVYLVSW